MKSLFSIQLQQQDHAYSWMVPMEDCLKTSSLLHKRNKHQLIAARYHPEFIIYDILAGTEQWNRCWSRKENNQVSDFIQITQTPSMLISDGVWVYISPISLLALKQHLIYVFNYICKSVNDKLNNYYRKIHYVNIVFEPCFSPFCFVLP